MSARLTVHHFAKKLVKSQIDALVDCDYDNLLAIHADRVEQAAEWNWDDEAYDDARRTLCHIIGTRIDLANDLVENGEAGARNWLRQLERLLEAVGLTHSEVA